MPELCAKIWHFAKFVRTNLALFQICTLFFLFPIKVYKFGSLPNLCTQILQCAKFLHFLRPRQYLGTINFCTYKFSTLPNLSAQILKVPKLAKMCQNYKYFWQLVNLRTQIWHLPTIMLFSRLLRT